MCTECELIISRGYCIFNMSGNKTVVSFWSSPAVVSRGLVLFWNLFSFHQRLGNYMLNWICFWETSYGRLYLQSVDYIKDMRTVFTCFIQTNYRFWWCECECVSRWKTLPLNIWDLNQLFFYFWNKIWMRCNTILHKIIIGWKLYF